MSRSARSTREAYSRCADLYSLLESLGSARVRVVGHSMGGDIALGFAPAYRRKSSIVRFDG